MALLNVLESIVDVVGDRAAVVLDGGVRRAADMLTAVALGADAVRIGRLALWALAGGCAGEGGRGAGESRRRSPAHAR